MIKIINKLYNCPIGTNLYSPIFGEGVLVKLTNVIKIKFNSHHNIKHFDEYGRFSTKGECMLFPSKENRDWDNFNPILDGDILFVHTKQNYKFVYIYKNSINGDVTSCWVYYDLSKLRLGFMPLVCKNHEIVEIRKANEFEIEKILNELHKCGYVWDNELIDIKLKCGDKLLNKKTSEKTVVTNINDSGYKLSTENNWIPFNDVENDYEIILHFDFSKLEPFDKVLVRNEEYEHWKIAFFDKYLENQPYPFRTVSKWDYWKQCIPYNDDTKHFKDTAKQMPDFYKLQ